MSQAFAKLRVEVGELKKSLVDGAGDVVRSSLSGPASMAIIDAIVAVMEEQAGKIEELERKFSDL